MITQIREDPMKGSTTRPSSSIRPTSYSQPFSHPCNHPFTSSPRQPPPPSFPSTSHQPASSFSPSNFQPSAFHTHARNLSSESTSSTSSASSALSDSSILSTSTSTSVSTSTSSTTRKPNPLTKHFLFHMRGHRSAAARTMHAHRTLRPRDEKCHGFVSRGPAINARPVRLLDREEEWDEWGRGVRGVLEPRIVGNGWWAGCGVEEVLGW